MEQEVAQEVGPEAQDPPENPVQFFFESFCKSVLHLEPNAKEILTARHIFFGGAYIGLGLSSTNAAANAKVELEAYRQSQFDLAKDVEDGR